MPNQPVKVIVSNNSALLALYTQNGKGKIAEALKTLIESDRIRNISTQVIYMDDTATMNALSAPVVTDPKDSKQNKDAVDGISKALTPAYITILGGPDIVALQILDNPAGSDGDPDVPSDLPYASNSPYSKSAKDFVNASRVVGRLPGVTGSSDTGPLLAALAEASGYAVKPKADYLKYFGVSAAVWKGSSQLTANNVFGATDTLYFSPPKTALSWTTEPNALSHFVNCHGSSYKPSWYGQGSDGSYPAVLSASLLSGKLSAGTIAAAECCYGAQLYAPTDQTISICNTYLAAKSAAFCGSTTIAYGPASTQGSADLIAQYFLQSLLDGMSGGEAMLKARQTYVMNHLTLNGIDLKTLAQFYLLGDSSCRPVDSAVPHASLGAEISPEEQEALHCDDLRLAFAAFALGTATQVSTAAVDPKCKVNSKIADKVRAAAQKAGVDPNMLASGPVLQGEAAKSLSGGKDSVAETIHLVYNLPQPAGEAPVTGGKVAVVRERGGDILSVEVLCRRL